MSEHIQAQAMCENNSLRDSIKGLNAWVAEMKLKETKSTNIAPSEAFGKTDPIRNHIQANGENPTPSIDPSKLEQADKFKQRGNELVKCLKYQEAVKYYSDAIEINAEDPVFYSNRALCFLKLEQYKDCIEDCTRALKFDGKLIKAYYRRGTAHEYSGDLVAAERDYLSVLEHDPLNADGKRSLAYVKQLLEELVKLKEQCVSNKRRSWSRYQNEADYTPVDFQLKSRRMQSEQPLRSIQIKKCSNDRKSEEDKKPTEPQSTAPLPKVIPTPKTPTQFHDSWLAAVSDEHKSKILEAAYGENVSKLLGAQFNIDMLREMCGIIDKYITRRKLPITNLLRGIVEHPEMGIFALMMDAGDRNLFRKLVQYMRLTGEKKAVADIISNAFESLIIDQ